jgi:hypothetical protein
MEKRDDVTASKIDRPPGIFTREQREFIAKLHEYEEHSKEEWEELSPDALRQRRYRIRQRARNAIADFLFIFYLPVEEIKMIFEEFRDADSIAQVDQEGIVYEGVNALFSDISDGMSRSVFIPLIEIALASSIGHEYIRMGKHADVEVDIDVKVATTPLDELKKRFDNREELTRSELDSLVMFDRITQEEWQEYPAKERE